MFVVLSYSLLIAYALTVQQDNMHSFESKIDVLLARRDELSALNQELAFKKANLSSELILQNEKKKLVEASATIDAAQADMQAFLKAQEALKLQQQIQQQKIQQQQLQAQQVSQTNSVVQTVKKVPVTTTKTVAKTVKKPKTRAS